MDAEKELMSASDILKKINICRTTFYKWVRTNKIKPVVFGTTKVYDLKEIEQHLKSLNSRSGKT